MSSYDEPKVQHKSTVQQIIDARQRALRAVSEVRQVQINTPHPNLAPSSGDDPQLPVIATQAVVDYLLQLRPYRSMSQNWGVDFGTIHLPKQIESGNNVFGRGDRDRLLWICRQPEVPVGNISQLIQALNSDIYYSTNRPPTDTPRQSPQPQTAELSPEERDLRDTVRSSMGGTVTDIRYRISPDEYPGEFRVDRETAQSIKKGAITPKEAVDMGMTVDDDTADEDAGEEDYVPAIPNVENQPGDTRGRDGKVKSYKLVMGPDRLLHLVELADEIAAEVDMLAEIDAPDHSSGRSDAV